MVVRLLWLFIVGFVLKLDFKKGKKWRRNKTKQFRKAKERKEHKTKTNTLPKNTLLSSVYQVYFSS